MKGWKSRHQIAGVEIAGVENADETSLESKPLSRRIPPPRPAEDVSRRRPKNPVFSDILLTAILAGITPSESVKVRHSPLASENLTVTWKLCKIGGKLVLITNR